MAAAPVQVAAALAGSPWRDALRIEPAGSGSRVVLAARIEPDGLARAVERLVVEDLDRLHRTLTGSRRAAPRALAGPGTGTSSRTTITRGSRNMSTIALSITIDAPSGPVWDALADFGGVATWNPGVKASALTSEATEGTGITRECRLAPMGVVRERVVGWDVNRSMAIEIYEHDNIPGFRGGLATLDLEPVGADRTRVSCRMDYRVGLGVVGATANSLGMRRIFNRTLGRLLAGLKYHVETGRAVDGASELDLDAVVPA